MKVGKTVQEGGAVYNFTGPQGFGVANMAIPSFGKNAWSMMRRRSRWENSKKRLQQITGRDLGGRWAAMTAKIANELKEAGKTIGEKEVAAILNTVVAASTGSKGKREKES